MSWSVVTARPRPGDHAAPVMLFNEQHAHNDANDSIRPSDTEELARMEAGFSRAVAEELYSKCDQDRDGSLTSLGPETRRPCALVLARRGELPGHRMACVRQLGHGGPSVARRNLPLLLRLRACRLSFQETDVQKGVQKKASGQRRMICAVSARCLPRKRTSAGATTGNPKSPNS